MSTHFAVIADNRVQATRSSASRHVDGEGKWGVYRFATARLRTPEAEAAGFRFSEHTAPGTYAVFSYHGTEAAARGALKPWLGDVVLPVTVTAKRLKDGATI